MPEWYAPDWPVGLHDPRRNDRRLAEVSLSGWEIWLPDPRSEWYTLFKELDNTPVQLLRETLTGRIASILSPCTATNWLFHCKLGEQTFETICYEALCRRVEAYCGTRPPFFEEWQDHMRRESRWFKELESAIVGEE